MVSSPGGTFLLCFLSNTLVQSVYISVGETQGISQNKMVMSFQDVNMYCETLKGGVGGHSGWGRVNVSSCLRACEGNSRGQMLGRERTRSHLPVIDLQFIHLVSILHGEQMRKLVKSERREHGPTTQRKPPLRF